MQTSRVLLALIASTAVPCPAQDALVPAKDLKPLESSAKKLARAGRERDARVLLDVMRTLGHSAKSLSRLEFDCEKALEKKPSKTRPATLAKPIAAAAKKLATHLVDGDGDDRTTLAREVLRLDYDIAVAHEALGHERDGQRWVEPWMRPLLERRGQLAAAIGRARHLSLAIALTDSDHPVLTAAIGRNGVQATCNDITVHSSLSRPETAAIVREAMRATAFANFACTGDLRAVRTKPVTFLILQTREAWDRAIDHLQKDGAMQPGVAASTKLLYFFWDPRNEQATKLGYFLEEFAAYIAAETLLDRRGPVPQAWLRAGLYNWTCTSYLGTPMPKYRASGATVAATWSGDAQLAQSGFHGLSGYLDDRAPGAAPLEPRQAMLDKKELIYGENLLACTSLVSFCALHGELDRLFGECGVEGANTPEERANQLAAAMGLSYDDLLQRWRRFRTGSAASIVQGLTGIGGAEAQTDNEAVVKQLYQLRFRAMQQAEGQQNIVLDPALCRGAASHAAYLRRHDDQRAWPTRHQEEPGREGFDADGAWVAAHARVATGCTSWDSAIAGWLGNLYDRIQLLDPGVLRVGAAHDGDVFVLDCESTVYQNRAQLAVCWPHDDMRGVPTRYVPGGPDPVEGVDTRGLGYPITLLWRRTDQSPTGVAQMRLFSGRGHQVDCHFCSPATPTNPAHPTPGAYSLIPKSPLTTGTTYKAVVEFTNGDTIEWSFRT